MKAVDRELRIRHLTVDEAGFRLEQYLNDAFMAGLPSVRIVHGKGEGILRQAVQKVLAKHPLVVSFRLGDYGEGDYGVTVVDLAHR